MARNKQGQPYGEERIARQQARVDKAEQQILALLYAQAEGRRLSYKGAGVTMFDPALYGKANLYDLYTVTGSVLSPSLMEPLLRRLRKEGKILYDENEECYKIGLAGLKL